MENVLMKAETAYKELSAKYPVRERKKRGIRTD